MAPSYQRNKINEKNLTIVIAIDGPAGSGKGTIAKKISSFYNFPHLDSGILYRSVAYLCYLSGQKIFEEMNSSPGVLQILHAAGRSDDLFENKQFGSFGEAAIVTIVADDKKKEKIFDKVFNLCDLKNKNNGLVLMTKSQLKLSKSSKN